MSMEVDHTATSGSAPSMFDYCLSEAQKYKQQGNDALTSFNYQGAIGKYLKVQGCVAGLQVPPALLQSQELSMLAAGQKKQPLTPQQEQQLAAFLVTVHLNMAQAYLKLQNWHKVLEYASKVLAVDQQNTKALFRRGSALLHLRQFPAAIQDLTLAAQLAPTDSLILQHLQYAKKMENDEAAAAEHQMRQQFKNMFTQ